MFILLLPYAEIVCLVYSVVHNFFLSDRPANGGKPCEGSRQEMRTCRLPVR